MVKNLNTKFLKVFKNNDFNEFLNLLKMMNKESLSFNQSLNSNNDTLLHILTIDDYDITFLKIYVNFIKRYNIKLNFNCKNKNLETPLHLLMIRNDLLVNRNDIHKIYYFFTQNNADQTCKDILGITPRDSYLFRRILFKF